MDQNAQDIRRRNLEAAAAAEAESPVFNDDEPTQFSELFFKFDNDNISQSALKLQEDEIKIYKWVELMNNVNKWFNGLLQPHILKEVPLSQQDGTLETKNVESDYLNQIQDMEEANVFLEQAKSLEMDKRNIYKGVPFGLYERLHKLIRMRNVVLRDHNFCLSRFKQLLWKSVQLLPKVEQGDACFNYLNLSINELISTGLFLRKYRSDLTSKDLNHCSDTASLNKIIDMRNDNEREDYLDTEKSVFVEPQLNKAERYLHDLITAKNKADQLLAEKRNEEAQKAGRYLRSKKNKRVNRLSKRNI
jgi:hypothetical protein